jgi:ADP-dependent phosphofructokinase/glucokinase
MTRLVVLGLGGTVDFELRWDAVTLERLAAEHDVRVAELDGDEPIRSERDLIVSILSFLQRGTGGERYVASSRLLEAFAVRFDYATTLGGTGVRAGIAARLLGIESTQHLVSIDDSVRELLPESMDVICSAESDTTDPHLVVQYPAGARITLSDGVVVAPHPNRLIYVNDPPNRVLVLSERLPEVLEHASLFLVSGFNSMQERDLLVARVAQLREAMRFLPSDAIVLFEDAGYHTASHGLLVLDGLSDQFDVYSLNEDELRVRIGRDVDLLDPEDVGAALDALQRIVPVPVIVLHTRHYALVSADEPSRWLPVVDGGVVMSGARYAYGDAMTAQDLRRLSRTGARSAPGRILVDALSATRGARIAGVPAFDLPVSSPTTIGLGDTFVGGMVAALELERRRGESFGRSKRDGSRSTA